MPAGELRDLVRSSGAQLGFAQDPDGDRLAVADETGHVLDSDGVLALAVNAVHLAPSPEPFVHA